MARQCQVCGATLKAKQAKLCGECAELHAEGLLDLDAGWVHGHEDVKREMMPNHELNRRVAEAMGWTNIRGDRTLYGWRPCGGYARIPDYSGDWRAAGELMSHMPRPFALAQDKPGDLWEVVTSMAVYVTAATATEAIALAYLAAKEPESKAKQAGANFAQEADRG